ncbi:MAG: flagellar hook-associated protein FlgL [Pseudomonadota bacterium]
MRISTGTMYEMGAAAITQQQQSLLQSQQQVATGHRIVSPADDPAGSAQILQIGEAASITKHFADNQGTAKDLLAQTESVLGQVGSLLQDARVIAVNAGNGILSNQDRVSLATELQGKLDDLVGLSNSTDGNGNYLFSGFQGNTQPFSRTGNSITYNGDDGQRLIQVTGSRQLASSESGADIFLRVRDGNGVFTTGGATTNTGGGVIDGGQVTDPSSLTGDNYQVIFSTSSGATTYNVVNTTTGATVNAPGIGNAYTSGSTISFDGLEFTIQGAPANGDQFTVAPSTSQSVFTTLQNLITQLQTSVTGTATRAALNNGVSASLRNIDQAIDKTLTVRTSVGARQQEVESLISASADTQLQYKAQLSQLQDTDYATSITDVSQKQVALEAAQQSFTRIAGKTLFDYL